MLRRIEFDDETKRLQRQHLVYKTQVACIFVLSAALVGQLLALVVR